MIKLTDEQRQSIVAQVLGFHALDREQAETAQLIIDLTEAEFLRLNGITEMTPEQKRAFTQDMIADMNGEIEG